MSICHVNNHNNVAQKPKKITDIHEDKIESDKKHLNKQMIQSLQILRIAYILNITCHHYMPKYFQVSDEKDTNKHILVLRCVKHHTSDFLYNKGYHLDHSVFEE